MTDKNKNIFSGPKARLVLAVVVVGVIIGGISLYLHHSSQQRLLAQGTADVAGSPSIDSVPGAGNPSNQYVQTQNLQNQQQAALARKNATSAVPTITRPGFMGNPDAFGELPTTAAATTSQPALQCPIKKVVVMYKPNPANCSLENLKLARQAGVNAEELLCQGCSCPILRDAGYTAGDLKAVGYEAAQLKGCGFTLDQLVQAGYSAADLKAAGFSAKQLSQQGFTPGQLAAAGFTPAEISAAGYSASELSAAGINANQNPECNASALAKAHAAGVSAAELKAKGCGLAALKAAGYTATQLKAAGFSAADLKAAGFSASELKAAGFSAGDLKTAGFSGAELKAAGFSNLDLSAAGMTPAEIAAANAASKNCDPSHLKQLRDQGVSAVELKNQGCGLAALKAAGYTASELKNAGFTAQQLKDAGYSAADLRGAGFSAQELKAAGFSAKDLKNAGYSATDLKGAGFSASELKGAGFSAAELKDAGFSANQLRDAGFSAADLKKVGYTADQLKAAGFSAGQLKDAGFSAAELQAAGFSAKDLRSAGYSAADLKAAGFSPNELLAAGYTKGDLLRAGYTPAQAGYANGAPPLSAAGAAQQSAVIDQLNTEPHAASSNGIPAGATMPSITDNTPQARLAQLMRMQQQQMSLQQQQDAVAQMQGAMSMQAQKLLGGWSNHSTQTLAIAPSNNEEEGEGQEGAAAAGPVVTGPVLKAGTVMYAVLDTSINSDESSPIMAHIVSGPLKGAKLLGQFTRVDKRVLISFNLLNDPSSVRSIGISAVAIDPDTARTAVSGDVNNHYLLRYGTLFASSFLQGFSNALLQSGTSQGCFGPFCFTSQTKLNTGGQIAVGLGNVGEQYANQMGQNFNRPPTIKIQGGTGIGILLMNDLTVPAVPASTTVVVPVQNPQEHQ